MVFYWTDGFSVFLLVREDQFIGDRGQGGNSLFLRIYSGKSKIIRYPICQFRPKFLVKTFFLFFGDTRSFTFKNNQSNDLI